MKILEKIKGKAKLGKKKTAIVGAIVLVGLAGLIAVVSGRGGQLSGLLSDKEERQVAADLSGIQEPKRDADIVGLVESVSGNEVKILLLNASDLSGGDRPSGSKAGTDRTNAQRQRPAGMPQDGQSRPTGSAGGAARTAMLAELKKKSIGEETVTIPVGIQMIKMGMGGVKPGAQAEGTTDGEKGGAPMGGVNEQASITDVTVDSTVKVWLNAGAVDKKIAEFVSIMG